MMMICISKVNCICVRTSRFVVEILLLIIVNNVSINTGTLVPQTHEMANNCDGTIRFSESVILKGTNLSDISCTVAIQTSNTFNGLLLNFNALNLSNSCSDSSLEVDDVFGNIRAGPLCRGKLQEKIFKTDQSVASFKYSSDVTSTEAFSVIITSFNNGTNGKCTSSEFQCHNKLCISKELVCNQVNECSDNSDERPPCDNSDDDYITLLLEISIPIASAAFLLALCVCCCCCCKKTKFYTYVRIK